MIENELACGFASCLFKNPVITSCIFIRNVFMNAYSHFLFLCDYRKQQAKQLDKVTESTSRPLSDDYALLQPYISSQEQANEYSLSITKSLLQPSMSLPGTKSQVASGGVCSEPQDALSRLVKHTLPLHNETSISPYACFYGHPKQSVKMGWLDKLSPQG